MCDLSKTKSIKINEEKSVQGDKQHGIDIDFCTKNTWFLKDNTFNVSIRFMAAAGKCFF